MKEQIKPELLESNKLIAEFMEVETRVFSDTPTITHYNFNNTMLTPDKMKYNVSWDWLLPVIEKISSTVIKGTEPFNSAQYVRVEIVPCGYVKINNFRDQPIFVNVSIEGTLFIAVYKAIVCFIEWYNKKGDSNG